MSRDAANRLKHDNVSALTGMLYSERTW